MADEVISNLEQAADTADSAAALKSGTAGVPTIIAMVIAAAAPITCTVTLIPLGILLGNGIGTPGAILVISLVIALFALGFVRVLPHIKNTGAFYAYITAGIGPSVGLVSAYALILAYVTVGASVVSGFGYFSSYLLGTFLHLNVSWWICAIVGTVLGTLLSSLGVSVQGRVLLAVLSIEVITVVVLDIAILATNGFGSYTFIAFAPSKVFSGSIGIAAIYVFMLFLGFEGTAIYAEEAKAPDRSVPRATYWVIAIIAVFHIFTTWSLISGGGGQAVQNTIAEHGDPQLFTFDLSDRFVGHYWTDFVMAVNLLSLFVGLLAFQNAAGRYGFALARDKVFPSIFSRTHRKHGTPIVSLWAVSALYIALTLVYSADHLNPILQMTTSLAGIGTIALIILLTLTSLSIALFFLRRGERNFTKVDAPLIATFLLGACAYAGVANYSMISGGGGGWYDQLPWVFLPLAVVGLGYGLYLKTKRPEKYATIGSTRL